MIYVKNVSISQLFNLFFQVSNAPSAPKNTVKTNATSEEDKEIEAMLEKLKA